MDSRRLVVYLLLGTLLSIVAVVLMLCGRFSDSIGTQLLGVVMYAAAVPLLFSAKLAKLEGRLRELERRHEVRPAHCDCAAARPAPGEDA